MNRSDIQIPSKPDCRLESIAEAEEQSLAAVIRRVARRPTRRNAAHPARELADRSGDASE